MDATPINHSSIVYVRAEKFAPRARVVGFQAPCHRAKVNKQDLVTRIVLAAISQLIVQGFMSLEVRKLKAPSGLEKGRAVYLTPKGRKKGPSGLEGRLLSIVREKGGCRVRDALQEVLKGEGLDAFGAVLSLVEGDLLSANLAKMGGLVVKRFEIDCGKAKVVVSEADAGAVMRSIERLLSSGPGQDLRSEVRAALA